MADLPIKDLRESGLLWLINRVVFHPRGFALGMVYSTDGEFRHWVLQGDGSQPWTFAADENELFRSVEEVFAAASRTDTEVERLRASQADQRRIIEAQDAALAKAEHDHCGCLGTASRTEPTRED